MLANSRRIRSGCAAHFRTGATSGPRSKLRSPISAMKAASHSSRFALARVSALTSAFQSKRDSAIALAASPSPAMRTCKTSRRCALSSPPKMVNCSMQPPSARDWIIYARPMVRWATSNSPPCRRRASTMPNTWSTWTSTSMKARLSPSRALNSKATPSLAIV